LKNSIRPLLKVSLPMYMVLLCTVWLFYPEFTACSKDSIWCTVAYWATESAGRIGTPVIILITSFVFAIYAQSLKAKAKTFFKTFIVFSIVLSAFAFLNEHLIKSTLQVARPSHTYIIRQTKSLARLDSLYTLPITERRKFFQGLIDGDTISFRSTDARVLGHWVEEAGYSFPSGHSFNAFLLASILAFSIYYMTNRSVRWLYILPMMWAVLVAVSRVAIGAHSALDVSIGGALGILVSHMLLYFSVTQALLTHQRHAERG
jgi:phosphatidylglycerophosphatase B